MDELLFRLEAGVATLTLNRPSQLNALSESLLTALSAQLARCTADESIRVVVIAGSGAHFCAGHDLAQMIAHSSIQAHQRLFALCSKVMLQIQQLRQPVIARVDGTATAAGCQLVAQCDLAIASSRSRFAVSGVNLGLFCSTPSVALSRNIGRKQAFEMLVTGAFIDAPTAHARGLINQVVEQSELDAALESLCASIVAKPAHAITQGKQLFYRQHELGLAAAYQLAGQTMACDMMHEDAQEGVQAFLDKRSPQWSADKC